MNNKMLLILSLLLPIKSFAISTVDNYKLIMWTTRNEEEIYYYFEKDNFKGNVITETVLIDNEVSRKVTLETNTDQYEVLTLIQQLRAEFGEYVNITEVDVNDASFSTQDQGRP